MVEIARIDAQYLFKNCTSRIYPRLAFRILGKYSLPSMRASESQLASIATSFSAFGSAIVPQEEKKERTEG